MANREKQEAMIVVDVLRTHVPRMTEKEKIFACGVIQFFDDKGYLSEKQLEWARKFAVRLIVERDK